MKQKRGEGNRSETHLFQSLSSSASLANLFRASQIDQIEASSFCGTIFCFLLHCQDKTTEIAKLDEA